MIFKFKVAAWLAMRKINPFEIELYQFQLLLPVATCLNMPRNWIKMLRYSLLNIQPVASTTLQPWTSPRANIPTGNLQ
jgi:hypothetical protein